MSVFIEMRLPDAYSPRTTEMSPLRLRGRRRRKRASGRRSRSCMMPRHRAKNGPRGRGGRCRASCHASTVPQVFADSAPGPVTGLQMTAATADSVSVSWSARQPVACRPDTKCGTRLGQRVVGPPSPLSSPQPRRRCQPGLLAGMRCRWLRSTVSVGGASSACAVLAGGAVDCWGVVIPAPTPPAPSSSSGTPVPVSGIAGATSVGVGWNAACALLAGGTVDCWGDSGSFFANSSTPTPVAGITGATSLSVGLYSACAVQPSGVIGCWGRLGGDPFMGDRWWPDMEDRCESGKFARCGLCRRRVLARLLYSG